jgi:hypothetical protein
VKFILEMEKLFQGVTFYKKEDIEGRSIYVAKIRNTSTSGQSKFINLVCQLNSLKKARYSELVVESIQTRKLSNLHYYGPDMVWRPDRQFYDVPIEKTGQTKEQSKYVLEGTADLPISEVLLIHDPRKKALDGNTSFHQYPQHFNLLGALETFFCILVLNPPVEFERDDSYTLL